MKLYVSDVIDWIFQHDQAWEDFCNHFGIVDYLKELPEEERHTALIRIEEDRKLELYYSEEDDVVEIM